MPEEEPDHLPLMYKDVLTEFEEFRMFALPVLGRDRADSLPRVPLSNGGALCLPGDPDGTW